MPGNFSRAEPTIVIVALLFLAFANVYASASISKVKLLAPSYVHTYGDLGEWCMGKGGQYMVVVSQMGVCLLVPCVFLVLVGSWFDGFFSDALLPEYSHGASSQCSRKGPKLPLQAAVLPIASVIYGMRGHSSVLAPQISFSQVASAFGNLSLAVAAPAADADKKKKKHKKKSKTAE